MIVLVERINYKILALSWSANTVSFEGDGFLSNCYADNFIALKIWNVTPTQIQRKEKTMYDITCAYSVKLSVCFTKE